MWYSASLLFQAVHDSPRKDPVWEESIVLVEATSENEARRRAEEIGRSSETGYRTRSGHLVWRFDRVERMFLVEAVGDGREVFSRFLRDSEVRSLLTPFDDTEY